MTPLERVALHPHPANPHLDGARGYVLVLPGGGYTFRAEHEGPGITDFLAAQGIRSAYLDYPVAPVRYPEALHQVLVALADLRAGTHGEPAGPVSVLGFSAGGHLAGTAATATPAELAEAAERAGLPPGRVTRPDAVALAYPVASLVDRPHVKSRENLLGEEADEQAARAVSVDLRVDPGTPPLFLWHTVEDETVGVHHTWLVVAAAKEAGVPVEAHLYADGRHGLGLSDQGAEADLPAADWSARWLDWLDRQGVGPAAAS